MPLRTPIGDIRTLADCLADYRRLGRQQFQPPEVPVLVVNVPVSSDFSVETVAYSATHSEMPVPSRVERRALPEERLVISLQRKLATSGEHITIGRAPICDVVLPFGSVSKVHAQLSVSPEGGRLCDVGSTNGTATNNKRLAKGEWCTLADGQALAFGSLRCEFWLPASFVNRVLEGAL